MGICYRTETSRCTLAFSCKVNQNIFVQLEILYIQNTQWRYDVSSLDGIMYIWLNVGSCMCDYAIAIYLLDSRNENT